MVEIAWNQSLSQKKGWVEVIVGGMYSGKTEELIRRLRRAELARQKIQVFKPTLDDRYHKEDVTSHNKNSIRAIPVAAAKDVWEHLNKDTQVVGFDEGQFFDFEIVEVVEKLADRGIRVIVAGLDTDWLSKPFEPMPTLMAIAESVNKQHAVCMVCGAPANRTQRISEGEAKVEVGAQGIYEARCREHFKPQVMGGALQSALLS